MNIKSCLLLFLICTLHPAFAVSYTEGTTAKSATPAPPPPFVGQVQWADPLNAVVNGDNSVTKTINTWAYDASIVSQNVLKAGVDGYAQLTYSAVGNHGYFFSLSKFNNAPHYGEGDFSFYINGNQILIYTNNSYRGVFGTLVTGDVLKIERIGTVVKFYRNSTEIFSIAGVANDNLRVDISLRTGLAVCPPVTVNFAPEVVVKPQFTHPSPANNDGGISLNLEGQTAPVTYAWLSGETTSSITGKSRANYGVTVSDASGQVVTRSYGLGYPIDWINIENVTINANNSLTKSIVSQADWNAAAFSTNKLAPTQDGWLEFVADNASSTYTIGLSRMDGGPNYTTIDYGWIVYLNGTISIIEYGALRGTFGSLREGDVFRIAREGNNIVYYLNNVSVRTVVSSTNHTLHADVSILNNFGPTPIVTASFDKQLYVKTSISQPNQNNESGSIALSIFGAYPPVSINWSSGETSNLITNKARGIYSVVITDAQGKSFTRTYQLGYPALWTDLQKTSVTVGNTLSKAADSNGNGLFDGAAVTSNVLAPNQDGSIEFVGANPLDRYLVGFSRLNAVAGSSSVEYAFYIYNRDVYIYETGTNRGNFGSQAADNVYKISRVGSNIVYYINNQVVRTIATTPGYQLVADVSMERGILPPVSCTFTKMPQNFYAIANGNWNNPTTWSLSEGGAPAQVYPSHGDAVFIKGYALSLYSGMSCGSIAMDVTNENTQLLVDGASTVLDVAGVVQLKGENNPTTAKALTVRNKAKIKVSNP